MLSLEMFLYNRRRLCAGGHDDDCCGGVLPEVVMYGFFIGLDPDEESLLHSMILIM
jgi:hypothetical protein